MICSQTSVVRRIKNTNRVKGVVLQGASKKCGICFMSSSISIKLNANILGIYLIQKVRSIAQSGVQKTFFTISESRDISK